VSDTETGSLSGIDLFSDMEPAELERIERACSFKRYASQEQIIDRQNDSQDVFFVVKGAVRVVIYSLSGRESTLEDLAKGNHFGEMAAIDGAPRSASVMALDNCLIASLPQEPFLELFGTHPDIALKVMRMLTGVIRTSINRIMDLSTLAANNRVHADLLRLARIHSKGDNTAAISPIPTHSDIASRASTTRETVARVFSDLAKNGIVERQKKALMVLDVEQLSDMVEEVRGE